ncbi:MAG: hypothetical protein JRI23_09220 [Deltaproteobacteria bacterium]|jgi:hypothetical protein|nr:hypothetical protein [Deltaproteobacteria bacterium]MBW2531819.1 hypothetical protein [Deltaproteobacteria bacterium]
MWVWLPTGAALLAVTAIIAAIGCSSSSRPVKPPPPQVGRAPAELAQLSIHVHRLVSPPETPADHWDYQHMSGLTRGLRESFQVALTRAGYRVVVGRREPRDMVATIQADWPHDRPGVASLTVSSSGRVIDQLSAEIPVIGRPPRTSHLEEHAAVRLVHGLNGSAKVTAFARERAARRAAQIAATPAPPKLPAPLIPDPFPELEADAGVDAATPPFGF